MSEASQFLLLLGLLLLAVVGVTLWLGSRLDAQAAEERKARDAWARVVPREGCTREIPGCICARDNLGEWCVHRRPINTQEPRA